MGSNTGARIELDRNVCSESGEIRKSEAVICPVWCLLSDEPFFVANGAESNVLSLFNHFDRFQTASWDTCTDVNHETAVGWWMCPLAARDCRGGLSNGCP